MNKASPNTISILDRELLLVRAGGSQVHLAEEVDVDGRHAVDPERLEPDYPGYVATAANYDAAALALPRWAPVTLCGRTWSTMEAGEGGPLHRWDEVELVPTCGSCLRVVDRRFPRAAPSDGVELVAALIADEVEAFGSARVLAVPADQLEATRRAARRHLRSRGFRSNTMVVSDVLYVMSDDAYNAIDEQTKRARSAAAAKAITLDSDVPVVPVDFGTKPINWRTWASS